MAINANSEFEKFCGSPIWVSATVIVLNYGQRLLVIPLNYGCVYSTVWATSTPSSHRLRCRHLTRSRTL